MNYFVYILQCSDSSYYTGITNNLEKRVAEHNAGLDKKAYTFTKKPVTLVYCDSFNDPNQAIACEKQIKGWTRAKKKALIESNWDKLKELAICTNDSHSDNAPFDSAQGDKLRSR